MGEDRQSKEGCKQEGINDCKNPSAFFNQRWQRQLEKGKEVSMQKYLDRNGNRSAHKSPSIEFLGSVLLCSLVSLQSRDGILGGPDRLVLDLLVVGHPPDDGAESFSQI